MIRLYLISLLCFSLMSVLAAQGNFHASMDAASVGMGEAAVTVTNQWAFFNNIANIAQQEELEFGAAYRNHYTVEGFNTLSAVAVVPLKSSGLGMGVNKFGDDVFNTQMVAIGYAYSLAGVNLGLRANYLQYRADGDVVAGTKNVMAFDFGMNTQLAEEIFLGAYFFNVNQAQIDDFEDERVPSVLRIGFSYRPTDKLMVNVEGEKDLDFDPVFRSGIAYDFVEKFTGRVGYAHDPSTIYAGLGFRYSLFQFDYAFNTHQTLNYSHTLSISVQPNKWKREKK